MDARSRRSPVPWLAAALVLLGLVPAGAAATATGEPGGASVLREFASGKLSCKDASGEDFEHLGEYAIERMMGVSPRNTAMEEAMGRRFAGCGGPAPGAFGGMMGGYYGGPGSMMGGWGSGWGDEGSDGPSAAAMLGTMAVLIAAAGVAVLWLGRRRGGRALDTLNRGYARGEMSAEEYRERRRLLEGGS